jgi:hypothetical protein
MLDLATVRSDILAWSETFVERPHPALGGWPPCPYARQARLAGTVDVVIGHNPYFDLKTRSQWGMGTHEVIVYVYDPNEWPYQHFHQHIESANQEWLLPADLLALEDHPADAEIVNGVTMNQGTYALALCQSRSKLDAAAAQMASKGFYHAWPESYLKLLFANRTDPRQN